MTANLRATRAEISPAAIEHNVSRLISMSGGSRLMAVVKANGYGHGAVTAAEAALRAGAHGLCVALVQEGVELRRAGIEAPILVLSEQPVDQIGDLVAHGLIATVYSVSYIDALDREVRTRNVVGQELHLKIDTGMNRVGCRPGLAVELAGRILTRAPYLVLGGVFTHLASADDGDQAFTDQQVEVFDHALRDIRSAGIDTGWVHIANSAGVINHESTHRDLVRVGIATYGIAPDSSMEAKCEWLIPAMRLVSRVSFVKRVRAGEGISYGQRHHFERDTTVVTVPAGYADGVPRRLSSVGGEVLIGGRRHPMVGVVTMDQFMVDVGDTPVSVGDEVVLVGDQGRERITANHWGSMLGTIGYEVVCAISSRVPRVIV